MKSDVWSAADTELIEAARAVLNPRDVTEKLQAGQVASALRSRSGRIFTGVCIDAASSIGFCAEHAAVAAMLTSGEDRIDRVVAVNRDGEVKAPCGRCRELMRQMGGAQVLMPDGQVWDVMDLLPGQRPISD
ncbi:MAG: cytidine deaminase [Pseudomonadota bacterium]